MKLLSNRIPGTLLLLLAACGSNDGEPALDTPAGGLSVALLDSVLLEERGEDFLAIPIALNFHHGSGDYIVGDAISGKLFRYSAHGELKAVMGGRGEGPGEFMAPGAVIEMSAGRLAVTDWARDLIVVVDSSGAELQRIPVAGLPYSLARTGPDSLVVGRLARTSPFTGALAVSLSGDHAAGIAAPAEYTAVPQLRVMHPYISVVESGEHLIVGFSGSNVLSDSTPGDAVRHFTIPSAKRRPMPGNLEDVFATPLPDSVVAGMASVLTWLLPVDESRFAAIHLDTKLSGRRMTATGWVSVIDIESNRACVDAVLPVKGIGKPYLASRADTLVILEQRASSTGAPEAVIFRYLLDWADCAWLPLSAAEGMTASQ